MTQSLKDFLDDRQVDTDTVQQAARYYLAERTNDLTPEEMRQRLINAVGDRQAVDSALRKLERDSSFVENASLLFLSSAWNEPSEKEHVQNCFDDAKGKLPVVEVAILAIVAMYGMYLVATGGVKKEEFTVLRRPDGTLEKRMVKEYFGPEGPLANVVKLFASQDGKKRLTGTWRYFASLIRRFFMRFLGKKPAED